MQGSRVRGMSRQLKTQSTAAGEAAALHPAALRHGCSSLPLHANHSK